MVIVLSISSLILIPHSFSLLMRQDLLLGWRRNCLFVLIITQAGTRRFCLVALLSLDFIAGGLVDDMIISSR
jgi:hypothetical protein